MARELDALAADDAAQAGAVLLDVREPEEFAAGHAPSSRHVPLGELGDRLGELEVSVPIVCVCRSGNRSAVAAEALATMGFDAANLTGGLLAWAAEGLPVTTSSGATGVVL